MTFGAKHLRKYHIYNTCRYFRNDPVNKSIDRHQQLSVNDRVRFTKNFEFIVNYVGEILRRKKTIAVTINMIS